MSKETDHRLPNTVRPEKYTIELRPDLTRFTFQGEESVAIRVLRPVKTIELNASQLEVTQATLRLPSGRMVPATKMEHLPDAQRLRLTFEASIPKGSATLHLVFHGVLETLAGKTRTGTKVGIRALPDRIAHGRWGLEESIRVLDYLNEYYGVPYPLAKLDHIALQDFAAGAMENWGAITYRERILLFDPATSSAQTRQNIVDVIAHETAHMWFGDLVTMEWWDDLWLNESFATWMGTKTVNALHPEWKMWTQFFGLDTISGLTLDGLRSSHPIEVTVKDPAEIREIFDDISYSKGASILRMLEQFLGEASFRRGLRNYLKEHSYGNARTEDLWRALEAVSRQPGPA